MAAFLIGQQRQSVDRLALIARHVGGSGAIGGAKGAQDNGEWRRRRWRRRSAFKRQCKRQPPTFAHIHPPFPELYPPATLRRAQILCIYVNG